MNSRTLSGADEGDFTILNLKNIKDAIRIEGNSGVKGQVLQKSSTNKLAWGFVDDIEIPDGSITGNKLASNINISTTGNISAADITATNYFNQTNPSAVNTFQGELIVPKLETTITQDEAIRVRNGGIVRIYEDDGGSPDPGLQISLSGVNGNVFCNQIRSSQIAFPKSGGTDVVLNEDGLSLGANSPISGGSTSLTIKNIVVNGGLPTPNTSIICLGGIDTATDSAGNDGSILLQTGGLTLTLGNLILSNGSSIATFKGQIDVYNNAQFRGGADFVGDNAIDFIDSGSTLQIRINPDTGNIVNSNGKLTMNKVGATPKPTDSSTYTDWAMDVPDTNGHIRVGGNIICDGVIYGDVIGAITEEEVDCQRITCRTASPSIGGITGMILGTGAIISNDTSGINELTIDADTSGILCNNVSILNNTLSEQALSVAGNVTLSSGSTRTTTIGNTGSSGQTLEVLCNNVNIGETAGNQQNNILNYRGGVHTFTGEKVNIGDRLGYTNVGCSLEGATGIGTNNLYKNEMKYFHINGQYNSHTLPGTFLYYRILRSSTGKQIPIAYEPNFDNNSTIFTQPTDFNFVDINAETNTAKIELDIFYRHYKGSPDLHCRIDHVRLGAGAYPSQIGGPTLLINAASANTGTEIRVTHSFYITGLIAGNDVSFYPKFANTTSSSAKGSLMYGGEFGDMSMNISFVESYNGSVSDPSTSPSTATTQEILGETLHSLSYVDNESQNFTRIYNTSNKWIFDGSQDSGTDTLEAHFTATTTTGYIEFGFYANSLTSGMVFMCGIASATGGTSPFATTIGSGAVSIDAYKLGLFNGDTSQYSLKELLDFTSYENTYITSKFHFNNLTIGTEYKMALYGRCHNSGSIYINSGGKAGGTTSRSAHQQAFIKFYSYDSSLGGARTDDAYVPPSGDDY